MQTIIVPAAILPTKEAAAKTAAMLTAATPRAAIPRALLLKTIVRITPTIKNSAEGAQLRLCPFFVHTRLFPFCIY